MNKRGKSESAFALKLKESNYQLKDRTISLLHLFFSYNVMHIGNIFVCLFCLFNSCEIVHTVSI